MIFQIRADRDVTSKGPEGSGTRRRTLQLSNGPMTLVLGANPTYVDCDELPIEIRTDDHLLTKAVDPGSLDVEIVIINLKAERVQHEIAAGGTAELKAERVQRDDDDPGTPELKAERVQHNRKRQ